MSIYNIYAFRPPLHLYLPIHQRSNHVIQIRQWKLCRASGEIATYIPRPTTSRVRPPGINSMLLSIFWLAICSKITWACQITFLFQMCRPLNCRRISLQRPALAFPLPPTRHRPHRRSPRVQSFTSVLEHMRAIGNLVPRHSRRATSLPPTSHLFMSALAKPITNASGSDVIGMETAVSRVNKRYADIFR
jgi:hypothetical protein